MSNEPRYPARSLPYRSIMSCGCTMRLSKRQRLRGEQWCPKHRTPVFVIRSVPVIPKERPSQPTIVGWDVLESGSVADSDATE